MITASNDASAPDLISFAANVHLHFIMQNTIFWAVPDLSRICAPHTKQKFIVLLKTNTLKNRNVEYIAMGKYIAHMPNINYTEKQELK